MKSSKSDQRISLLILIRRPYHAARISVAVWAQNLALIGYRKQHTIISSRTAGEKRQSARTWQVTRWADEQLGSAGTAIVSGSIVDESANRRVLIRSGIQEDPSSKLSELEGAGLAMATRRI